MTAEEMWAKFCAENDVNPAMRWEAWAFCGGGPAADELAALVLEGTKTATASAWIAYENEGAEVPKPGDYSVILYDNGSAAAVIRDSKVSLVPFDEVSAEHAYKEGEGSRSLAEWREVHKRAFAPDYQAAGREFDPHGSCVLEEFVLVYPANARH